MSVETRDADVEALHRMGYAQELLRRMGTFSNFAVSFTIISILSGCLTLYGYGMNTGGPIDMNIGWPLVGIFGLMFVGLAMAEVCSSYPTAGGLYYWSAKLGGKNSAAWSWFTGWFNLLGQVGVTAGIDFGLALFVDAFLNLTFGYPTTPLWVILLFGIALFLHGLLNTFGVGLVARLNDISVWWHVFGVLIIVGVLFFVPTHHQSASFVFTKFVNNTGFGNSVYVFLIGLLLAQYTLTGYDASAHMTEETRNAAIAGPRGIVMSVLVSVIAGWILLIGVTSAIQDYTKEVAVVVPPAQIFIDAVGQEPGPGPPLHRRRRPVLLRHVVGDRELADDLRLLARRRYPRLRVLAPHQPAHAHSDQLDLVRRGRRLHPRAALPLQRRRLLRGDVDRRHRPLYRLRPPDPAPAEGRQQLRPGTLAARPLEPAGRDHRGRLDRLHRHPLLPAAGGARQQLHDLQLRARGGRRRAALQRRLVADLGQELVQGSQGPGIGGGPGQDRGRARRLSELQRTVIESAGGWTVKVGSLHHSGGEVPGPHAARDPGRR